MKVVVSDGVHILSRYNMD